ncbi:NAD(P)H-quinone oxidoreductase [Aquisediminimonas sediminicola]|uniref:NAD(P)H-quinone oxidoreductase n=1 Tax=Alteraquisediminimonas sediminicola TaxID=2676787 RepID=UPI001FE460B3|nr:NAD(P)H-quinone oxidoreductase [Aquisediminimonas sediminicola]
MRAVTIEGGKGPAEAMHVADVQNPTAGPGEILIRVIAAGVNRPDISQREGNYPPPPGASDIMGLEVAGTVAALGEGVTQWRIGDRVCALLAGGGYAEFARVDARHALPVPAALTLINAAGLPETLFTVFTNLFERGHLVAGETALIHGGNSGIGVTAIQMAKAAGARVITTVRGADKAARAKALGADIVIDVTTEDFATRCRAEGGVNVVLDIIGGDYFARNIEALNPDGRLVQIATMGGELVQTNLLTLMFKRLTLTASTLRGRPDDEKARLAAEIRRQVLPWIETGKVRIPIDSIFPLEQATEAHRTLERSQQFGKVVLLVAEDNS